MFHFPEDPFIAGSMKEEDLYFSLNSGSPGKTFLTFRIEPRRETIVSIGDVWRSFPVLFLSSFSLFLCFLRNLSAEMFLTKRVFVDLLPFLSVAFLFGLFL